MESRQDAFLIGKATAVLEWSYIEYCKVTPLKFHMETQKKEEVWKDVLPKSGNFRVSILQISGEQEIVVGRNLI